MAATNSVSRSASGQDAGLSASPASRATSRARGRSAALPVKTICVAVGGQLSGPRRRSRLCGPQPAAVGRAHVQHRGARAGAGHGWREEPVVGGVGFDAVPLQQPGPPLALMDVLHPRRARPGRRSGGRGWCRAAIAARRRLAFGPAAVEVHGNVHPAGLDGNRNIQAVGGEQFVPAHQVQRLLQPVLGRVKQAVVRVGAPQRMERRHGNQQVAQLQCPQDQQDRLSGVAVRCFHCLASSRCRLARQAACRGV